MEQQQIGLGELLAGNGPPANQNADQVEVEQVVDPDGDDILDDILDGGVALNPESPSSSSKKTSSECDLVCFT